MNSARIGRITTAVVIPVVYTRTFARRDAK
jgi:hypothetical protein